ncbi:MAG TPA: ABC transporter permease, partial [Candidatus Thermoplasmatota archaeon]|nr:ABC transporter permease [Candidatus Thermoplasmatota archaeon]
GPGADRPLAEEGPGAGTGGSARAPARQSPSPGPSEPLPGPDRAQARAPAHPSPSPGPSEPLPGPEPSAFLTFRATFVASFTGQVRAYTLTGWTITSVLSPVFLFLGAWVVLRFLTQGANPPLFEATTGYPDYMSFVVLGVAFYGLGASALEDGGNAVYEEESNGTWDVLSLAPFDRFVWMAAKTLAGLVAAFVDFFAVLLLGSVFLDVTPTLAGLAVASLGIVLTLAALQGFGFTMAALGLVWKQPYAVAFILSPVLILLSGMMFPVAALPAWLRPLSAAIPLTHGLQIVRDALLLDRGLVELAPSFALLAGTGALFLAVGILAFHRLERKARRTGVLGRY